MADDLIRRILDREAQASAIKNAVKEALREADMPPGDSRVRLTARVYPREYRALNALMERTGLSLNDALRLSIWTLEGIEEAVRPFDEAKALEILLDADLKAYNDQPEEDRDPALLRLIRRRADRIFRLGNPDADPDEIYMVTPASDLE